MDGYPTIEVVTLGLGLGAGVIALSIEEWIYRRRQKRLRDAWIERARAALRRRKYLGGGYDR